MKRIFNRVIAVIIISSSVLMLSCGKDISDNIKEHTALGLNKGALLYHNNIENGIKNLISGSYQNIDDKREIIQYSSNDTVLFVRDGKGVVEHKGREIVLDDTRIIKENISPKGNYLMYFIENESNALVLKLLNLETKEYEELNIPGTISGDLVDWYDNDTIIFYGVNNRKSGIFTYNLKTKVEKELYEVSGSYLTYLESTSQGIFFKEVVLTGEQHVKVIDKNGETSILSSNVGEIIDIEVTGKGIYILGSKIDEDRKSVV